MDIRLQGLKLFCRRSEELIDFSTQVSFFHGKISAGKSSIARLVDYCLGGDLEKTPAIQSELVSVQLSATIGEHATLLEREVGSNNVVVTWQDGKGMVQSTLAPLVAQSGGAPILGDSVHNLSDLVFWLLGITPIKVRRSKSNLDSPLVRLSVRDYMWYAYLQQDHLDSSFFRLEDPFKKLKSRDVMRFAVGYYTERLTDLEIELDEHQRDRRGKLAGAEQIRRFLREFGYESEDKVLEEITSAQDQLRLVQEEEQRFRHGVRSAAHIVDDIRNECRGLARELAVAEQVVADIAGRISEQTALRAEILTSKFKVARARAARIIGELPFTSCPCCGESIDEPKPEENCSLCGKPAKAAELPPRLDFQVLRHDLEARINDLTQSIDRHTQSQSTQLRKLLELRTAKQQADTRLEDVLRDYDSRYMAQGIELERKSATLQERLRNLERTVELPKAVSNLELEADQLRAQEERLRREIEHERAQLTSAADNIRVLEQTYLDLLLEVGVPGVYPEDSVVINRKTWIPSILPGGDEVLRWDFYNAGSGGKKTLLNVCYALAVHVVTAEKNLPLPRFLIIDTPMKNIGEDVNQDIFRGFYRCLYRLASGPLRNTQFIVIDKEFVSPDDNTVHVYSRYMTPDDPLHPPLISYYRGA